MKNKNEKKPGVNDKCPCGSGKKYKKCFLLNSKTCSLYLNEKEAKFSKDFDEILGDVLKRLKTSLSDLDHLFYKTKEDDEIISSMMQLVGVFTVIDVLGNSWYEYLGKTGKPSERFDEYINKFCFTNKNKEFTKRKYLQSAKTENVRHLRDNIIHFYGLGGLGFAILSNPSRLNPEKDIDALVNAFKKIPKNLEFIQPLEFKKIIIEGAMNMFESLQSDLAKTNSDEEKLKAINGVKRIQLKFNKEGVMNVNSEMANKFIDRMSL